MYRKTDFQTHLSERKMHFNFTSIISLQYVLNML